MIQAGRLVEDRDSKLGEAEALALLPELFERLPPKEARAVRLRFRIGEEPAPRLRSLDDVARLLHVHRNTAGSLVERALARLRSWLTDS